MKEFPHLAHLDPLTNVQSEASLPPEPACAHLSDVLALVEPQIGAALLDAPGRAALHYLARHVPVILSPFWGLEVRLGEPAARADFLWEVTQGNGGIPALAGYHSPHDLAPDITRALRQRSPFWQELGRFAKEWLDSPDWSKRLGNIWLEVDAASTLASSEAALDEGLDQPSLFWGSSNRTAGADRDLLTHLGALGRRFYGLELDQTRIDAITRTIPEEAKVFQMGVMGARAEPVARLCVNNLDAERRDHWLAAIGWPGDRGRLHDALDRLAPLCASGLALNVDIFPDRVGPKLGVEFYSAERMLAMDTWQLLHDELLSEGLARADKLAALADYPWYKRFRQFGAWRRTPPIGYPVIATNLHHVKLNFVEDAVIEAKVYLGVYRPLMDYSVHSNPEGADGEGGWLR